MISIGGVFRGPELKRSIVWQAIGNLTKAIDTLRGPLVEGSVPWVNAVYVVAGSIGDPDFKYLQYGKYSHEAKGVVVQIPVPREIVSKENPLPFLVEMLHGANAMAFEFFRQRGEEFPIRGADDLVRAAADRLEIIDPVPDGR